MNLAKKRMLAGRLALHAHQLAKEGDLPDCWEEGDVIDVITDILHYALRTSRIPNVDSDRILRCVKTHLTAELKGRK